MRSEVERLRKEERKSLREIHEITGVPKGTLSGWLKHMPLTEEELKIRDAVRAKKAGASRRQTRLDALAVPWTPSEMVDVNTLDRQAKARISEAAVLFRLALIGAVPLAPVFDSEKVDWFVQLPGVSRVLKIQVKWVNRSVEHTPVVKVTRTNGEAYVEGDYDVLVGYDLPTDSCHVWTFEELKGQAACKAITPESREAWWKLQ